MTSGIRRFSAERLALCAEWFELVETTDQWIDLGPIGDGESQSIRVQCGANSDVTGAAKPGPNKGAEEESRAAREKLAFDLAHLLELPIPPVILWGEGMPAQYKRGRSISAWAFRQAMKWSDAESKSLITDASRESAGPAASAMRVFHTWISDTDRKPDHVQVDLESPEGQLGVAFIDHAFSMSYVWKGPNHPAGTCPLYMPAPESRSVITSTADLIARLPTDEVSRLVNRIPASYLPEVEREHILSNLLARKGNLRAILGI